MRGFFYRRPKGATSRGKQVNRLIENRRAGQSVRGAKRRVLVRHAVALALGAAVVAVPAGGAHAAGFALIDHSAAGAGNAHAGGAAQAGDLSTVWFNPAGMTRFDGLQTQLAATGVTPEFDYTDEGTVQLVPGVGAVPAPGIGDDGGIAALLPANFVTYEITDRLHAGLAITVPFGLKTKYDPRWAGRFQAVKSEIFTTNINPAISFDVIPDTLSLGVGVSAMYMNAELSNALNNAALTRQPRGARRLRPFQGQRLGFRLQRRSAVPAQPRYPLWRSLPLRGRAGARWKRSGLGCDGCGVQ